MAEPDFAAVRAAPTWTNLLPVYRYLQSQQTVFHNTAPCHFRFARGGDVLLCLGASNAAVGQPQELLALDLSVPSSVGFTPVLRQVGANVATAGDAALSKEEILLRERQRQTATGLTAFQIDYVTDEIIFSLAGSLWRATIGNCRDSLGAVKEVESRISGPRLDAKLCPRDNAIVAFVRDNALWAAHTETAAEWRLSAPPASSIEDVSAGTPPYVVQEEFDRYTGFWWQPDGALVLFEQVDERLVDQHFIPSFTGTGGDMFRFPRVGTVNPSVELLVAAAGGGGSEGLPLALPFLLRALFPWHEYVVRVGWKDAATVWVQLLDRAQLRLDIVLIPLACFGAKQQPVGNAVEYAATHFHTVRTETAPVDEWVNVSDILEFLPPCATALDAISFIWSSERTGFRHLVLCTSTKASAAAAPVHASAPLTCGAWPVDAAAIRMVTRNGDLHVFFTAHKDTPLERHLYHICVTAVVKGTLNLTTLAVSSPIRLTTAGFSHSSVTMSPDCQAFVSSYTSISQAPTVALHRVFFDALDSPPSMAVLYRHPASSGVLTGTAYTPPALFTYTDASGTVLHGMIYTPPGWAPGDQGAAFPTLLYVYGGPHVQLVTNEYKAPRFLRFNVLARLGFCVVVLDCHGSYNRGIQFEKPLRNAMGTFEIAAQVDGLQRLITQRVYPIDAARVGIFGWSYGGYLSLMGLAQRPDIFKVAVSGAPVSCWEAYDTAYTERYMTLGATEAYAKASVLNVASSFPDEPNRLLIVHGLIDENVHFQHTALMVDALVTACKPYQLQVWLVRARERVYNYNTQIYPSERHGFRGQAAAQHFEITLMNFLLNNL